MESKNTEATLEVEHGPIIEIVILAFMCQLYERVCMRMIMLPVYKMHIICVLSSDSDVDMCNRMEQFYNGVRSWLWLVQKNLHETSISRSNLTPFQSENLQKTFEKRMTAIRDASNNLSGIGRI